MMYQNKLAVAIKSAGKVLREHKDSVFIPFGSEYSIFIKNLNTVRAEVRITIDGQDVGAPLVVNSNGTVDLERFIQNGNLDAGNRFKFIERNARVEEHRGVGIDDGLIRVEFQFERAHIGLPVFPMFYVSPDTYYRSNDWGVNERGFGSPFRGGHTTISTSQVYDAQASLEAPGARNNVEQHMGAVCNDAGITVPGSISEQKFQMVAGFPLEAEKHVIVLKLLGETVSGKAVLKPVTVKTKQTCPTCGHKNKATAKFCSECGTSLETVL